MWNLNTHSTHSLESLAFLPLGHAAKTEKVEIILDLLDRK